MLRIMTKAAAPVARAVWWAARPPVRKMATEAGERVVPTAKELGRTRELFNIVDDRLAISLKGVNDGVGRLEAQIVRLEGRMDAFASKMDTFATKESVKESIGAMETRLKYYLLAGTGGLVVTGLTVASRMGVSFFELPKIKRQAEVPETPHVPEQKIAVQPR